MKPVIYLDNAATTRPLPEVVDAMLPYFNEAYYNPSAHYDKAYEVGNILNKCRSIIAQTLSCDPSEIYFTSGGTESDNWALRFVRPGQHIITSKIEHHAILNTCKYLESVGVEVTYLDVDRNGKLILPELEKNIKENTVLITIMTANNEIGTMQPLSDISKIAAEHNVVFHTDAVQAYGHSHIDVNVVGVDMLSASSHKFNGPKGIGFLYISNRIPLHPMIYGGAQETNMRAGTENVPGIVGMAKAAELSCESVRMNNAWHHVSTLRNKMQNKIISEISDVSVNGYSEFSDRLANNLNVSFKGVRGEQLLRLLSDNGVCASTGSACDSSSTEPSHVLKAIGLSDEDANSSIRFSLSHDNTIEEINYTVDVLKRCVDDLRRIR